MNELINVILENEEGLTVALQVLLQLAAAFVGTVAFSVLFSVPKEYRSACGVTGGVGWAVYLMINSLNHTPIIGAFAASAVLTIMSRYQAVQFKAPTTIFLLCGIFTLVPGAGIYYTAYYTFMGEEATALSYGMDTIKMAVAIGLGIGVAYSIPSFVFGWKKEPEVWNDEN